MNSPQWLAFRLALAAEAQAAGQGPSHAILLQTSAICLLTNVLIPFPVLAPAL